MSFHPESPDRLDELAREAETRVIEWLDRDSPTRARRTGANDRRPSSAGRGSEVRTPEHRAGETVPQVSATLAALVRRLVRARESARAASESIESVMAAVVRAVELARVLEPMAVERADLPAAAIDAFACRGAGPAAAPNPASEPRPTARTGDRGSAEQGHEGHEWEGQ